MKFYLVCQNLIYEQGSAAVLCTLVPKSAQIQFFYNACTLVHHLKRGGKLVRCIFFVISKLIYVP